MSLTLSCFFLFVCLLLLKISPQFSFCPGYQVSSEKVHWKAALLIHLFLSWPFCVPQPTTHVFQCPPLEGAKHSFVHHVFYFCSSWGFQFRGYIPSRRMLKLLFNKLSSKLSFLRVNWKIFWWKMQHLAPEFRRKHWWFEWTGCLALLS